MLCLVYIHPTLYLLILTIVLLSPLPGILQASLRPFPSPPNDYYDNNNQRSGNAARDPLPVVHIAQGLGQEDV